MSKNSRIAVAGDNVPSSNTLSDSVEQGVWLGLQETGLPARDARAQLEKLDHCV